jgi:hypothetical protein
VDEPEAPPVLDDEGEPPVPELELSVPVPVAVDGLPEPVELDPVGVDPVVPLVEPVVPLWLEEVPEVVEPESVDVDPVVPVLEALEDAGGIPVSPSSGMSARIGSIFRVALRVVTVDAAVELAAGVLVPVLVEVVAALVAGDELCEVAGGITGAVLDVAGLAVDVVAATEGVTGAVWCTAWWWEVALPGWIATAPPAVMTAAASRVAT